MDRRISFVIAGLATATIAGLATAKTNIKPLKIGDTAPAIEVSHWLKGEQVNAFEPGNVYVLEFWATWCGPCRASIPHLTELQAKYKDYDVTFIGVSDEDLQDVVKFLTKSDSEDTLWGNKVEYTLATDPDRSVYESYMYGVGQQGIPTAFIIGKDTKVEWVGHPTEIDDALEAVVKGNWNRNDFATEFEPAAAEKRKELAKFLVIQEKVKVHKEALKVAKETGDIVAAEKALDAIIELDTESNINAQIRKFEILLKDFNAPAKAYGYARQILDENRDDAMLMNALAWITVDEPGIETRDFDFALDVATKANELTDGENPFILDTLARVYFEKGDIKNAIKYQKKAVEFGEDSPIAAELKEVLKKYKSKAGTSY